MAIHFFTESNLFSQDQYQAYGPVKDINDPTKASFEYRVSSKLTFSQDAKAFATIDGLIFVQPQNGDVNATLVNLILLPYEPLEIDFTPVYGFIYRGLKKENFIQSNELIDPSNANSTDLIEDIWNNFNKLKIKDVSITVPSKARIGWDSISKPGNTNLNEILNNSTQQSIEGHPVKKGMVLGYFEAASASTSFEIVLRENLYTPDLSVLRAEENIISVQTLGTIEGDEPLANMQNRDRVFNYIDPTVFFNLFYEVGVLSSGTNTPLKGFEQIYTNITSKFFTSEILYIDIRDEFGKSINFLKDNQGNSGDIDFGKHYKLGINVDPPNEINHYLNYWSLFSLALPSYSFSSFHSLNFSFRKQYNPTPLIYVDHGSKFKTDDGIEVMNEKFWNDLISSSADWTDPFEIFSPNLPNLNGGTSPSWFIRLYLIKEDPPVNPPIPFYKESYLDNIFGPIIEVPAINNQQGVVWNTFLGKRFINARRELGIQCMVQMGVAFSSADVAYFTKMVDFRRNDEYDILIENLNNTAGSILNSSGHSSAGSFFEVQIMERDKPTKNLEFRHVILQDVIGLIPVVADFNKGVRDLNALTFSVKISRTEYDNSILFTAKTINPDLPFSYFKLPAVVKNYDQNDVYYAKGEVNISGIKNNFTYSELQSLIQIYSIDATNFNSMEFGLSIDVPDKCDIGTDDDAYFSVDGLIEAIAVVEEVFPEALYNNYSNTDEIVRTATRIRVHSYGKHRTYSECSFNNVDWYIVPVNQSKDFLAYVAMENAIRDADYTSRYEVPPNSGIFQTHYRYIHLTERLFNPTLARLITHADENTFQDNPSPYLLYNNPITSQIEEIDLGQILYGFESIVNPAISFGYTVFSINISFDLAGIMANIATPVAEVLAHKIKGESPHKNNYIGSPITPDIDRYYELSAPMADLIGNADAIGISRAYEMLKHNSGVQLSDIFSFYYKGTNTYPVNPNGQFDYYSVQNRWLIVGLYLGVVEKVNSTTFNWLSNPAVKVNLEQRMLIFIRFWYNVKMGPIKTGVIISTSIPATAPFLHEINANAIQTDFGTEYGISFSQATQLVQEVTDDMNYILYTVFLPFLKSSIEAENPSINLI